MNISGLFSPDAAPYQPQPQASDTSAAEKAAADAAALKEKTDATKRQGARSTLLTDPGLNSTFSSNPVSRKTLLGTSTTP